MPRARNIKPSFFKNDLLSDQEPLGRLLFIGMWTICDYRGCLEWRPKRVKAEILPYDECDVESLAINLDKSGFIRFYSDGDKMFVKVVNFTIHQNPHKNERQSGSDIPDYTDKMRQAIDLKGLTINRDTSGTEPDQNHSDPADSCSLNPDSCSRIPDVPAKKPAGPSAQKNKFSDDDMVCAQFLLTSLKADQPDVKKPNLDSWANHVRLMRERDERSHRDICEVWKWARADSFWQQNILSPSKLRDKYDQLRAKMRASHEKHQHPNSQPRENAIRRVERQAREVFAAAEAEEAGISNVGPDEPAFWSSLDQSGGGHNEP